MNKEHSASTYSKSHISAAFIMAFAVKLWPQRAPVGRDPSEAERLLSQGGYLIIRKAWLESVKQNKRVWLGRPVVQLSDDSD